MQTPRWFDPTLNLGHVLTIAALVGGGGLAYGSLKASDQLLELRVEAIERANSQEDNLQRAFQAEMRRTLGEIQQDLAVLKDARERGDSP